MSSVHQGRQGWRWSTWPCRSPVLVDIHHIEAYTEGTLVTLRSSGSSYLNRVELQNGCLSLAHANLFIPSTLNGSCCSGGDIDKEKLTQNLMSAAEVYIQRCNNAPCGDTEIHLYLGADSSELQNRRERLLKFLKGSRKEKGKLQREHPDEYSSFERVWSVREQHMVKMFHHNTCFSCSPVMSLGVLTQHVRKESQSKSQPGLKMGPQFHTYFFPYRIPRKLGAV